MTKPTVKEFYGRFDANQKEAFQEVFDVLGFTPLMTGSAWYGPFDDPKDLDVFARVDIYQAIELIEKGWEIGGSLCKGDIEDIESERIEFISMRKNGLNLIACFKLELFLNFKLATDLCRMVEPIPTKIERIKFFRRVLYKEGETLGGEHVLSIKEIE